MTAALIGWHSGFWYAVALAAVFAVLVAGFLAMNALAAWPDRWVSEVDRRAAERAAVDRVLLAEGER